MPSLEAVSSAGGIDALVSDSRRIMNICNACRYCEGYCAVFPAMERRLEFSAADLNYLANLCHNCGACYTACQYAPPHEFALDLPRNLAELRLESYQHYARPRWLGSLFRHSAAATMALCALFGFAFIAAILVLDAGALTRARDSFYDVIPHSMMVLGFGAAGAWAVAALLAAFAQFWRDTGEPWRALLDAHAWGRAGMDALRLTHLGGGGEGCAAAGERPSVVRRRFHHLVAYGFGLCFAATLAGAFYHYVLRQPAPYALFSAPVVLGSVGGTGMIVGCAGLWWLERRRDPALGDPRQGGMNGAFIVLLLLTGVSGMLLLALRHTGAMASLLAAHLAAVMALFLLLPCGKFVHAVHRFGALLRYALERRRPMPNIGAE